MALSNSWVKRDMPIKKKNVEPSGHEGEINQAADGDKYAANQEHFLAVAQVDQHRQEKQQQPHGARIEAVEQSQDDGEKRQPQAAQFDGAEQRQLNGLGWTGSEPLRCRLIEQCRQFPPGGFGAVKADQQLSAQVKRRHADGAKAESIGEILQIG